MALFVRNEAVEYGQNALAVLVNAIQIGSKSALKILRLYPFIDDDARHVDILPKSVDGVASKEESIEESRLALRGQRVEIVSRSHRTRAKRHFSHGYGKGSSIMTGDCRENIGRNR